MGKLSELDLAISAALSGESIPLPVEAAGTVPGPDMVRAIRMAAGMTLQETADAFGYSLRSWQHKEESGAGYRALSVGEWNFLMLIAGVHPVYQLRERRTR